MSYNLFTQSLFIVFVIISVIYHVGLEFKYRLDEYLGGILHFTAPRYLRYAFFVLATSNLVIPFIGGLLFLEYREILISYMIGGLVGDTFGTHIIPTFIFKRESPATTTWKLYLPIAIVLGVAVWPLNIYSLLSGMLSFVLLWPTLMLMKKVGLLKSRNS